MTMTMTKGESNPAPQILNSRTLYTHKTHISRYSLAGQRAKGATSTQSSRQRS